MYVTNFAVSGNKIFRKEDFFFKGKQNQQAMILWYQGHM